MAFEIIVKVVTWGNLRVFIQARLGLLCGIEKV